MYYCLLIVICKYITMINEKIFDPNFIPKSGSNVRVEVILNRSAVKFT